MIFPKFSTTIGILCFVLTPRTANFVWASSRNLNDPPEVSHKMYLKWVRIVQGLALNRLALLGPYLKNEMKKRCWFWIVRNFIIRRKKLLPFFRLNPKRIPWTNLTSRSSDPVDFKFFTKNRFWPFSTREQWKNIKMVAFENGDSEFLTRAPEFLTGDPRWYSSLLETPTLNFFLPGWMPPGHLAGM